MHFEIEKILKTLSVFKVKVVTVDTLEVRKEMFKMLVVNFGIQ